MTTDNSILDDELDDLDDPEPQEQQTETPTMARIRRDRDKFKRERDEAKAETAKARRELQLAKAGLPDLNEKKVAALLAAHGDGDETPEAFRQTAADLGWIEADDVTTPTAEVGEQERESAASQGRIAAASTGATRPQSGMLTPGDLEEWPQDRIVALLTKHKDEYEKLKRGEEIPRPPGF